MGSQPCVSVIVPFYDSERYIRTSIESLLQQEDVGGPYEIILIDNGSTDASASIASEYDGLTILEEKKPGAYAARNTGIRRSSAPLVAFTDADCQVGRDWLRSLQDAMEDPSIGMLVGYFRYPEYASWALRLLGAYENAKTESVVSDGYPFQQFAYANNMVVRRSVFDEIGLFEEWKRAADSELVHRMASRRPDLRLAYSRSAKITHLEFVGARKRIQRLAVYARNNTQISTFKELTPSSRLRVLMRLLTRRSPASDRLRSAPRPHRESAAQRP